MSSSVPGLAGARWLRSKRCNTGGNCVEVAFLDIGLVALRDSKSPDTAPLMFHSEEWGAFLTGARNGEFDPVKP